MNLSDPLITERKSQSYPDRGLALGTRFITDRCGASTNGLVGTHFIPAAHDHGLGETTAASLLAL
ncbi:MAG TPA: hypothetical protein VNW94_25045, partial [Streptosporangiaceae bacterium]|nr:hypothetical protein [Streptosporangiaceae bacterium]